MERSGPVVELTKALNKFQGAMKSVAKSSVNPFFKSRYADLDAVWDACRKPLTENGLALVQTTDVTEGKLFLITTLFHISGEYITSRYPLIPMKQVQGQGWTPSEDPQSTGSAITYARRYAMCAILGISAEEDTDGNTQKPLPTPRTPKTGPSVVQATTKAPQGDVQSQPGPKTSSDVPEPKTQGDLLNNCLKVFGLNKDATLKLLGIESLILIKDMAAAWYEVQQKMAAKENEADA